MKHPMCMCSRGYGLTVDGDLPAADCGVVGVGVVAVLVDGESDDGVGLTVGETASTETRGVVGEVTGVGHGGGGDEADGGNDLGEGEHGDWWSVS